MIQNKGHNPSPQEIQLVSVTSTTSLAAAIQEHKAPKFGNFYKSLEGFCNQPNIKITMSEIERINLQIYHSEKPIVKCTDLPKTSFNITHNGITTITSPSLKNTKEIVISSRSRLWGEKKGGPYRLILDTVM